MFSFLRRVFQKREPITIIPYEELGCKCAWFVISTNNIENIQQYFTAQNFQVPIQLMLKDNFVLVCLPQEPLRDESNIKILKHMSQLYGSTYYFASDRRVDFYEWRQYKEGANIRSFQYYAGEGVLVNEGELTGAEQTLELDFSDWNELIASEQELTRFLDEEDVINVAKAWLNTLYE